MGGREMSERPEIPAYFAGRQYVEEDVQGGSGDTPDEAVEDYLANHADDEVDYLDGGDADSGKFIVEIYTVRKPSEDEYQEYDFELDKSVEARVVYWNREPDPEWPGLSRIIYLQEENTGSESVDADAREGAK
jgi:hypothetical protein